MTSPYHKLSWCSVSAFRSSELGTSVSSVAGEPLKQEPSTHQSNVTCRDIWFFKMCTNMPNSFF